MRLSTSIFIALLAGMALGTISPEFVTNTTLFRICGMGFVNLLKLLSGPVVFFSILQASSSLDGISQMGRVGLKTFFWYTLTTCLATTSSLLATLWLQPGSGMRFSGDLATTSVLEPSIRQTWVRGILRSPVHAWMEGNLLPLILVALTGCVILLLIRPRGRQLQRWVQWCSTFFLRAVGASMYLAPIGVFCLMAASTAGHSSHTVLPLIKYLTLAISLLIFHGVVIYSFLLFFVADYNPITFARRFYGVWIVAMSTVSSNATLPVSLSTVIKRLGVSPGIARFTLPLGATCNMDGLASVYGVATVFIAQAYNLELSFGQCILIVVMTTLGSIGTAGVPGVGLLALGAILQQLGLPIVAVGTLMGVSRFTDIIATAVNVTGDAVVTCIIAKSEARNSPLAKTTENSLLGQSLSPPDQERFSFGSIP